jgi:hypothetical protein
MTEKLTSINLFNILMQLSREWPLEPNHLLKPKMYQNHHKNNLWLTIKVKKKKIFDHFKIYEFELQQQLYYPF